MAAIPFAMQEGGGEVYNSRVTYTCTDGRRHEDGYEVKAVVCTDTGYWTEEQLSCGCKVLFSNSAPHTTYADRDIFFFYKINSTIIINYWYCQMVDVIHCQKYTMLTLIHGWPIMAHW